jgi:HK97 family phage portal protein
MVVRIISGFFLFGIAMKNMNFLGAAKFLMFKNSREEYIREWLAAIDEIGNPNDINVTNETALKFNAVFACLRVLAETFASIPVAEYKKLKSGDRDKTDDTGLYDVLHNKTNDEMTAYNFKEAVMYQLNTGGNAVCQKLTNKNGEVLGLFPYDWSRVEIYRNKETKKIEYKIDRKDENIKSREQIFHIPGPSLNGIIGLSPIEYARSSIKLGLTYEKFGINFYKNGAMPSGIFKHPQTLKDQAYERLKKDLEKNYQSLLNAGKPILAEDGLDFVQLTIKPADAQLIECKRFQVEDICRFYRVPLHLVQNLDRATNNNIEHQSLEFVMYTMLPWFKRVEDCINTWLLSKEQRKTGYYFEFNVSALLRGDMKSMAESFAIGRQWGWLSVNDIRRLTNMNSIGPAGDIYLQPMNMVEAGKQSIDTKYKALLDEVHTLIESKG